jgi:hypothetical protein
MAVGDEVLHTLAADTGVDILAIQNNQVSSTANISPAGYMVSKKANYGAALRSAVASADTGDVHTKNASAKALGNSSLVEVYATFSVASANAKICLIMHDAAGTPVAIGLTESITFIGDAALTDGTRYYSARYIFDCGKANWVWPLVQSISSGTVTIYVEPI